MPSRLMGDERATPGAGASLTPSPTGSHSHLRPPEAGTLRYESGQLPVRWLIGSSPSMEAKRPGLLSRPQIADMATG
jgi:hypothetical protein